MWITVSSIQWSSLRVHYSYQCVFQFEFLKYYQIGQVKDLLKEYMNGIKHAQ